MRRIDRAKVGQGAAEIRLFAKAKDESLRLPWFLDYYFDLGVDRMFIVDNGSTDATREIALDRPDVHLFSTDEPFSRYPNWVELLLDKYGKECWCVVVDLDEMLLVPPPMQSDIRRLTAYLEGHNFDALRCFLLDMYPEGPIADYAYAAGQDPLALANLYDPGFVDETFSLLNEANLRRYETRRFSGGMRARVFGVDPNLTKVPLFRHTDRTWLAPGAHSIDGARIADTRSALLHFKYLEDFVERTVDAARHGQYAGGSALLRPMAARLESGDVDRLDFTESHRLSAVQDLVDDGIISVSDRFRDWCRSSEPGGEGGPQSPSLH